MDNKTNVYTLDVSEKTFNDVQVNKFKLYSESCRDGSTDDREYSGRYCNRWRIFENHKWDQHDRSREA